MGDLLEQPFTAPSSPSSLVILKSFASRDEERRLEQSSQPYPCQAVRSRTIFETIDINLSETILVGPWTGFPGKADSFKAHQK